jgi:SAM-dependent methyltransferase
MDPLTARIVAIRQQIYPRTSYSTAGAASSTLLVFAHTQTQALDNGNNHSDSKAVPWREVTSCGEFAQCEVHAITELPRVFPTIAGHVVLVATTTRSTSDSTSNSNSSIDHMAILRAAIDCVVAQKTSLCYVILSAAEDSSCVDAFKAFLESAKDASVEYDQRYFDTHKSWLFSIFRRPGSQFSTASTASLAPMVSFNGQPSVQSQTQFRYLWSRQGTNAQQAGGNKHGAKGPAANEGKLRVLQRLSDKELLASSSSSSSSAKNAWSFVQWDQFIARLLAENKTDGAVYSQLRKLYVGRTLEEDTQLSSILSDDPASGSHGVEDTHEINGRDDFMAKLITECVPDRLTTTKGAVRTMLDYGCAEGGITAVVCNLLNVPLAGRFGCDVRNINKPSGFTFYQLPAEEDGEDAPILPQIADSSIDVITASMVFHHVKNISAVLKELHRIVSSRGVLIIREHNCESSEDAAFLDITHGLYSLSWSAPQVEWPAFLSEYHASYRSKSGWDELITSHGFVRTVDGSPKARMHFDSQSRYKPPAPNQTTEIYGRFGNLQKAYYAVYEPVKRERPPPATQQQQQQRQVQPVQQQLREHQHEDRRQEGHPVAKRMKAEENQLPQKEIFESSKHPGCFYVMNPDGSTDWVTVDLAANKCKSSSTSAEFGISVAHYQNR